MKLTKYQIKLLFFGFIINGGVLELLYRNVKKGITLSIPILFGTILGVFIVSIPFVLLYLYAFKNKNRIIAQSTVRGMSIWCYLVILPLLFLDVISFPNSLAIISIIHFFIGIFLIYKYNLPKAYIWISLFLSVLGNLYLLSYGFYKFSKKTTT
jgi:hypothetical protein